MLDYMVRNWYWSIDGAIWSSVHGHIEPDHPDYVAFLATGTKPTIINSLDDLRGVIASQAPDITVPI